MYLKEVLPFIRSFVDRVYPGIPIEHIEFSAQPASASASGVMLRYMTFEELEQRLVHGNEAFSRIELGPAYSVPLYTLMNQQNPDISRLVVYAPYKMDFDLERRGCCDSGDVPGKKCCAVCWEAFVVPLVTQTEAAFRKHEEGNLPHRPAYRRHWFYSGGRGVHVWFEDPLLAVMDSADREQYLDRVLAPLVQPQWRGYIDRGVSTQFNHLIRCPMSLHDFKRVPSSPLIWGEKMSSEFYLSPFREASGNPQERDQHLRRIKKHLARHLDETG